MTNRNDRDFVRVGFDLNRDIYKEIEEALNSNNPEAIKQQLQWLYDVLNVFRKYD